MGYDLFDLLIFEHFAVFCIYFAEFCYVAVIFVDFAVCFSVMRAPLCHFAASGVRFGRLWECLSAADVLGPLFLWFGLP